MTIPQSSDPPALPLVPGLHDTQHDHIISCLDFHLHPTIFAHLQHLSASGITPRIADVKHGLGNFLASLRTPFPVDRTGFDAYPLPPPPIPPPPSSQSPSQDSAGTLTYHSWDILSPSAPASPFPVSASAKFDVVVLRGLHLHLLSAAAWERVLGRVHGLVAGGGWVQWVDFDPVTARIAATRPLAPDAAVRRTLHAFTDAAQSRRAGNAGTVARALAAAGFGDVDADLYPLRPKVEFTEGLVWEIAGVMVRWGVWGAEEAEGKLEGCLAEVREAGALVWYDLWCQIGRKAEGKDE